MRRRDNAGGKAVRTQRRKTLKRRQAPKAARRRKPSAVDANEKIEILERRLNEALAQQAATSEILHVISNSLTNAQTVFSAIARSAAQLCEAFDVVSMASMETSCVSSPITVRCRQATSRFTVGQ